MTSRERFNSEQRNLYKEELTRFRSIGLKDWNKYSDDKLIVFLRAEWKCEYCGLDGLPDVERIQDKANALATLVIEHIQPKRTSKKFEKDERNWACSCRGCNHIKEHYSKSIQVPLIEDLNTDRETRIHLVRTLWILPRAKDWASEANRMRDSFRD